MQKDISISKAIIYGSEQDLSQLLKQKPQLDFIDEYGYTPLIQTAIINSATKAKLILDTGASVDFTDLTGRTALFWAADNGNIKLCQLCLNHLANPNQYSSGAQPILVMPLLKRLSKIKELLVKHDAKIDFAQDFINTKLIGHSFELEGRIDIVDTNNTFIEVELEGFYLRFTLEIIAKSLIDFKNNFSAKKLKSYFSYFDKIISALQTAIKLISLQHYLIDIKKFLDQINNLLDDEILILPISFGGHAITLIKFGSTLIRCDRGEYGREHGTVIYYTIGQETRFTKALCRELLYKRQSPEFINRGLVEYLDLKPEKILPLPSQKTGNCSWANVEALIPAITFELMLNQNQPSSLKELQDLSITLYHSWQEWNKNRSLDFCIQSISNATKSQQAAKIALLAAILFQSCDHKDHESRHMANKILAVLANSGYQQPLKFYAQIFGKNQQDPLWKNFAVLLEEHGIDSEKLSK